MAIAYNQQQPAQQSGETFLQRQQRVYSTPTQTAPQGQQSATSPVSSTGRISADAPASGGMTKAAPQPAPQPAYQGQQGAPQSFVQAPAGGYATYQPTRQAPQAETYNPGPQGTYQAQQVQQFQAPRDAAMDQQQQRLVNGLLANPASMTPQMVDQMKAQQTEQALAMQKQMLGQLGQNAASRGIDPNSGYAQMLQRQAMQDTQGQILAGNRNIDIEKAKQDRADTLGALGAADAWQNSNLGRAVSSYNTGLTGQEAQRSQDLAQIDSERSAAQLGMQAQQQGFADAMAAAQFGAGQDRAAFDSLQQAQQADLSRQFQNAGLMRQDTGNALQQQSLANQMSQFGQSLGFDREKFGYQKEQDAAQMAAQQAAQGAADERWADQMAMQYQQQQMDQYNTLLQAIMGGE